MYNINIKNIRSNFGFYFLFLFMGCIFFVPMFYSLFSSKTGMPYGYDQRAKVKFVEVETVNGVEGIPTYYYDVNGEEYKCSVFDDNDREPSINDAVYYRSSNPYDCKLNIKKYDASTILLIISFLLVPSVFIIFGIYNIIKIFKRLSDVRYLNKYGKLVKNLPYRLENSNLTVNNVRIKQLVICYFLPDGNIVVLRSDPKFDKKLRDADGCVDLVIDENNPTRYFIDLEINRKGGNLPQDFCNQEKYKQFFQNNNNVINPYNDNSNVVNQYNNPYDD